MKTNYVGLYRIYYQKQFPNPDLSLGYYKYHGWTQQSLIGGWLAADIPIYHCFHKFQTAKNRQRDR